MNESYQNSSRGYREKWCRAVLASSLTPGQKLVATGLSWHWNFDESHKWCGMAWRSAGALADEVGMKTSSTRDALVALRKAGWLIPKVRTTGGRGSWVYMFDIPDSVEELSQSTNGVSCTTESESVEELSQSQSTNGVRVSPVTESESVEELTDSIKDTMNESSNESTTHSLSEREISIDRIKEFKDAYPTNIPMHLLKSAYIQALKDGATEDGLVTAATNYAAECERTQQETRFIKFAATFLKEGTWRDYVTPRGKTYAKQVAQGHPDNDSEVLSEAATLAIEANNDMASMTTTQPWGEPAPF